jgi:hypothetical protein
VPYCKAQANKDIHPYQGPGVNFAQTGAAFARCGTSGAPLASTLGLEGTLTGFYGDPRPVFVTGEIRF